MSKRKNFLPNDITTKISKTSQTRGADDDVIYQNRVNRNSTVLINYENYNICKKFSYENGFIVLIKPEIYFSTSNQELKEQDLTLGKNLLVFYETREQWSKYPPLKSWTIPTSRTGNLGGEYITRIPALTSNDEKAKKINKGYNSSNLKGAGIRVYEYASKETYENAKIQLEFLFWHCIDIDKFIEQSEFANELRLQKESNAKKAHEKNLDDIAELKKARIIDNNLNTICPLCLEPIEAMDFCKKEEQAEGRDVPDLTVTNTSLFHIQELRVGQLNHRPYNLAWGHHFCNVVVKDAGIQETLKWMKNVLKNNNMI